jgi:hypothetical protein
LAQIEYTDVGGQLTSKLVYRYDAKNVLTEIQTYNGKGVLYQREIYNSDTNGNPTKISVYLVSEKFGGTVNELQTQSTITYSYK